MFLLILNIYLYKNKDVYTDTILYSGKIDSSKSILLPYSQDKILINFNIKYDINSCKNIKYYITYDIYYDDKLIISDYKSSKFEIDDFDLFVSLQYTRETVISNIIKDLDFSKVELEVKCVKTQKLHIESINNLLKD